MLTFSEGEYVIITGTVVRARDGKVTIEPRREIEMGILEDRETHEGRSARLRAKLDRGFQIRDTDGAA